jgi:hypothetical protein
VAAPFGFIGGIGEKELVAFALMVAFTVITRAELSPWVTDYPIKPWETFCAAQMRIGDLLCAVSPSSGNAPGHCGGIARDPHQEWMQQMAPSATQGGCEATSADTTRARTTPTSTYKPAKGAAAPSFQPSNNAAALRFAGCYSRRKAERVPTSCRLGGYLDGCRGSVATWRIERW